MFALSSTFFSTDAQCKAAAATIGRDAVGRRIFYKELGKFFRDLREARGLGQNQAAKLIRAKHKAKGGLGWLEGGRTKCPDADLLRAVSELYRSDYSSIVAEVVRHQYGVSLGPTGVDGAEIARLTAELESEREKRAKLEGIVNRIAADLRNGGAAGGAPPEPIAAGSVRHRGQ